MVRHLDAIASRTDRTRAAAAETVDVFLPTITKWSRWKDRKKKIDWPLFPGYCFARFDPRNRLPMLKCSGVVSIVSVEGEPSPIPDHQITGIRTLIESELAFDPVPAQEGHDGRSRTRTAQGRRSVRLVRKARTLAWCCRSTSLVRRVSVEVDAADVKPDR